VVRKFLLRYDTQMKVYEQPLILNLFWLADLVLFIVLSLIPYRFIRRRQTLRAYESEILQVIQGRSRSLQIAPFNRPHTSSYLSSTTSVYLLTDQFLVN